MTLKIELAEKKEINREERIDRFFTVQKVIDVNEEDRSFEHIISSESVDSHGSIIKLNGWDLARFKDNPVVFFGHDSRSLPIGQSTRVWRNKGDKTLMSRTRFAGEDESYDLAETMFKLATASPKPFLRGWSVGFKPMKWKERDDISEEEKAKLWDPFVYLQQELWEYSLVPLPSNTEAISKARGAGIDILPFVSWVAEDKSLLEQFCKDGICLPGVNDGIELQLDNCLEQGFVKKHLEKLIDTDERVIIKLNGEVRPDPECIAENIAESFRELELTDEEEQKVIRILSDVRKLHPLGASPIREEDPDPDDKEVELIDELQMYIVEEQVAEL